MRKKVLYYIVLFLSLQQLFMKAQGTGNDTLQEPAYLKTLLTEGIKMDSISIITKALYGLTTHYYYNKDADQVNYWANYTDSLVQARNINPDVYYDAHRNRIIMGLTNDNLETSISDIIQLFNQAQNTSQEYGMACASELVGTMYQVCHHDSAALVAYHDASKRLMKIGGHLIFQIRLLSYTIEIQLASGHLKEAEAAITRFEKLVKQSEMGKDYTAQEKERYSWMLHSFHANLYLHQNQIDKAKEALDKSSSYYIGTPKTLEFATFYYLYVKARYLKTIHQYEEAVITLNQILDKTPEQDAMNLKAEILFETGDFKEALVIYDQINRFTGNNNDKSLIRQMNSLRILYDKNNQIALEKEVQLNNLHAEENHRLSIFSFATCTALLLLSLVLIRYLKRSLLLKNALINEKKALLIAQETLSLETQKAEEANQMKNIFVANISHEIRTPLNAVIKFATLLAKGKVEEKDKPEFISLINKNSDLLLSLVNRVLDLSKEENEDLKATSDPTNQLSENTSDPDI